MRKYLVMGDTDLDIFLTVPKIPTWDEGILATQSEFFPGGKAANTAVQLFSLGSMVTLFTCIGDDFFGQKSLERIKKIHMDERCIFIEPGEASTYCVMLLDNSGEKALVVSASEHIYPYKEIVAENEKVFAEVSNIHLIGLQPEKILHILPYISKYKLSLSIDLDSAAGGFEKSRPLIEAADILFLNRQGIRNFFPNTELKNAMAQLQSMGPSEVVCTLGAGGIMTYDGSNYCHVPGFQIHPVDTSGSGDACIAAYLHGKFQEGLEGIKLLEYANGAGALVATKKGGQSIFLNSNIINHYIKSENKDAIMENKDGNGLSGHRQPIYFYEPYDSYGYFCNLSLHPIEYDGVLWPTAEHCYQAQKHSDISYREKIRHAKTCEEAIELGRNEKRDGFRKNEWINVRLDVMKDVVRAKFLQHPDLKDLLLATEDAYIAEHTENDFFWGDGLNGTGKNHLGKILMEVREEIKNKS